MRVGLLGCGAIARRSHIPALQAVGASLTAFWSRTTASAEAAAADAGTGEVVPEWAALLGRDDVDAVVISTPNALHGPQALAAVEAGKHVLVEKPFTVDVASADAVLSAAAARGVVVMTAHNARFTPSIAAARDAVRRGDVGGVTAVRAVFCHGGPLAWAPEATWFLDRELAGGGALLDLGVHLVDSIRFVLDDDVTSVAATLAGGRDGVEEDGLLLLDTRKGVVGSLHAGWRAPAADFGLTVVGDAGRLLVTGTEARLQDGEGERLLDLEGYTDTVQGVFAAAVEAGRALPPDGHDGRAAVAVVEAAYASAREGRTVQVS
ncbi:MAG TPA: Gfo/Idh/MocA family oxidoreductase [Mycobacteriales bacterium]|nr:Gfo/Idh/MocA family oxidoreductase [Mycobacteriales bacterium]